MAAYGEASTIQLRNEENLVTIPNRRTLLAAPLLAAALVATGGTAATASTRTCQNTRKPKRPPNLGTATLRRGSRGVHVRSVQNLLNHAPRLKSSGGNWYVPCPLAEDGVFGAGTEARVKDGQRALGLTPDGVVGPATRRAAIEHFG